MVRKTQNTLVKALILSFLADGVKPPKELLAELRKTKPRKSVTK